MSKRSELAAARRELLRAQHNTGRKLKRLEARGINTKKIVDPRKDVSLVNRYTLSQVQGQLEKVGEFNKRSNQWVPGTRGEPIPSRVWGAYKSVQTKYNQMLAKQRDVIGGLNINGNSLTVQEYYDTMVPRTGPNMGGGTNRWFPLDRKSTGIPNAERIPELIKDLENKMHPNYQSEQETRIRENFSKLLKHSDRGDLIELADALTPSVFSMLFNFSTVVYTLAENYQLIQKMMDDDSEATESDSLNESFDEVRDILKWAGSYMRKGVGLNELVTPGGRSKVKGNRAPWATGNSKDMVP